MMIALAPLLLTIGMAYGQSITLNQSGIGHTVSVTQEPLGPTKTNQAVITQAGAYHRVDGFLQYGPRNLLTVEQQGENNVIGEWADQGRPGSPSYDGTIVIEQLGHGHEVWEADQAGHRNELTIEQRNGGGVSAGNFADVEMQWTTLGRTRGNEATILQTGVGNRVGAKDKGSGLVQVGTGNVATVTQDGNGNHAATRADHALPAGGLHSLPPPPHDPFVQHGVSNSVTIEQDGADVLHFALQKGTKNELTVSQAGDQGTPNVVASTQRGRQNQVSVDQFGEGAFANVRQEPGGSGKARNNTVTVTQHGASGKRAYIAQHGPSNRSIVTQL
jgi:hypothetical protein